MIRTAFCSAQAAVVAKHLIALSGQGEEPLSRADRIGALVSVTASPRARSGRRSTQAPGERRYFCTDETTRPRRPEFRSCGFPIGRGKPFPCRLRANEAGDPRVSDHANRRRPR
jgi:hypothetical protein